MDPQNTGRVNTSAIREIPLHKEAPVNSSSKTIRTLCLKVTATAALLVSPFIISENKGTDSQKILDAISQRANPDGAINTKGFEIRDKDFNAIKEDTSLVPKTVDPYIEF